MGWLLNLMIGFVGFSGLLISMAEAERHYYTFEITEKNFTRLCETKKAMVVNESIPGPVLYVNKGDTAYINVINNGDRKVTIHWHGVKQPRNPWFDGPEFITQCGIKPGNNFTYEVIFSDEEGTLWWHAHSDWTRNTIHGAIVIYPEPGTTYPFPQPDGEEILVFGSWYTYDVNARVDYDLEIGFDVPMSDSYTINSQPGDFCNCSKDFTYRWQVEYGKTYHIRIINGVMNTQNFFAIAGHNFTVVNMDAAYVKPFVADYLMIAPGQTMEILLKADQPPSHYYMAMRQFNSGKESFTVFDKTNVTAILEYKGNYTPPASPSFPSDTLPSFLDLIAGAAFRYQLKSLTNQDVPNNITTSMYITASQNQILFNQTEVITWLATSLNNISWQNPKIDVLQAYYYNLSGLYTEDFPDMPETFYDFVAEDLQINTTQPVLATKLKVVEYGEEVEMVFQSSNVLNASEDHPMHLHGHSFYVVGSGFGNFDFVEDPKNYNLVDPPYVNTATVPKNGWATIRFRALNPGVWMWHCHLDKHLTMGMATVMIVKNGGTPETTMRKPPAYMPECDGEAPLRLIKADYPSPNFAQS
ncbi:putative laccase-9 [Euphorbia lathyris]|uniref:putative laccase-9 n=1 Tax=Euphorbia lathyris TaxID=212925 RepID=UPI0033138109